MIFYWIFYGCKAGMCCFFFGGGGFRRRAFLLNMKRRALFFFTGSKCFDRFAWAGHRTQRVKHSADEEANAHCHCGQQVAQWEHSLRQHQRYSEKCLASQLWNGIAEVDRSCDVWDQCLRPRNGKLMKAANYKED